jgi:sulfur carrier protein ThiS
MRITLEMHDALQRLNQAGQRRAELNLSDGVTVGELLMSLGMDMDKPWNAALDGALAAASDTLHDGSQLIVFAPIEGG